MSISGATSSEFDGKKKQKKEKSEKLWQFLISLLQSPMTNPSLIKWENETLGIFKLVNPDVISQKWGQRRNNDTLSYEYFSRALRYHYKDKTLLPVPNKRLVYQFGDKAMTYIQNRR